ncbi:MAG: ribosome biogenesis GTPase YlqF, partial [Ruminococcus sp.]|nr:ribosome biogenesis GTPase YlqF [Ruminococcus sp.]
MNAKTKKAEKPSKPSQPKAQRPQRAKKPDKHQSSEHNQIIQWYPGHMTKTKRRMEKDLKLVDAVAEIIDARIPVSSRNPDLASLTSGKPRIVLLNKCDMADSRATAKWVEHLNTENVRAIPVDCKSGRGVDKFVPALSALLHDRIESYKAKGMVNPTMRVMIVGIPNVGNSSLINKLAGSKRAKVEDRPGVTRTKQCVKLDNNTELLDMPGVLWP